MHCANCGAAARPEARFCVECGHALGRRCADCGYDNPGAAKFCAGCGGAFGASPSAAPVAREDIAERRPLTVMFCDLADSTVMSTQLDPEDYRDVIFTYQRTVAREIEALSGFVAKYMGDGVLAYFGYPAAQEDDAERSIRASLAVAAAVEATPSAAGRLRARIGIATGQVIIGDLVGEGVAREQAIAGETPNLAARLQSLAEGGGVVICSETRALVGELFELATLGPVALKGFDRPQRAFRVRGANERLSRFEALRSQDSTFVGREEELAILARRWKRATDGEPQIVLLSADAGVGKSRLISTFRHQLPESGRQTLSAYCAPYARDSAFHPFLRALEARCGFTPEDTPDVRRVRLSEVLRAALGEARPDALEIFASLLSLPATLRLTPQRQKDEATQLFADLTLRSAEDQPSLFVMEDAHWVDPSSQEVLRTIVRDAKPGLKLMLAISCRPEYPLPSEWLGQPNVTSLTLSRLRNADAQAMLAQISAGRDLDGAAARQILTHADGVPLYIEEIARAVLERGAASGPTGVAEISVPTTLQASLLGRLDRLAFGKEVAQIGAAIGRDFPRALLAAVAAKPQADFDAAVGELIKADLVAAHGAPPNVTYLFRHALIQDVAYSTLLRGPRQALHDRIATALKDVLPELAESQPEILARHLSEAQRWQEAVRQWRKAAVKTLRGGAWNEGLRQLEAGLRAVAALPEGEARDAFELDLRMMVGGVSMGAVGHSSPAAQSAYERAYTLARGLGRRRDAALAGSRLWLASYGAGDLVGGERSVDRVLEELGPDIEPVERALVRSTLLGMLEFQGRFIEMATVLKETELSWARQTELAPEEYYFMDPATHGLTGHMVLSLVNGCGPSWTAACDHVRARLDAMGPIGSVICVTMLIYINYVAGAWEAMPEELARFDDTISRIEGAAHYRNLSRLVAARLRTMAGHADALEEVANVMSGVDVQFAQQHLPRYQMIAGDAFADVGEAETARGYYTEALKGGRYGSQQWLRSEVLRRQGDLARPASTDEARKLYMDALETARQQGALLFELRAALALAEIGGVEDQLVLRRVCDRFQEDGASLAEARRFLAEHDREPRRDAG
jgi:class 3 adenylate cyclase